jgi:deoxyribodipyrimidine photolyase-related protein
LQLLFADQLGPHFDLGGEILLPEVVSQFAKRKYHRQKAHLILYAIRSRSLDARVTSQRLESYRDVMQNKDLKVVVNPTSRPQRALVERMGLAIEPSRGFCSSDSDWKAFRTDKNPRLENFSRRQRTRLDVLMEGAEPSGGQWNFDQDNRKPSPKSGLGLQHFEVIENEIDAGVRRTLDELEASGQASFIGVDGPRKFAGNRVEALAALQHFIEYQLEAFGPYEDAVFDGEWVLAHSMLSAPMNLGLLDPIEVVRAVEAAYLRGEAPIESVEGFVRQIIGWRDYVWHLYWEYGEGYLDSNFLEAVTPLPEAWKDLDASAIEARCLSKTIENTSTNAWTHHIQRLMVIGNVALQRGYNPREVNDWLVDAFVDGTPWVMPANAIGMSLFADGGRMSTKPYAAGGAYINRMTNYCGGCKFDPKVRVGDNACPITAGYWHFLSKNQAKLSGNQRMWQAYSGLRRLSDIEAVNSQESRRKSL